MTDEQIDTTALREHAGKGRGDDCLLPKASVNRMADELDSLRALLAGKPAVPQKYDACDPGNWRDGDDAMGNHTAAAPAQPCGDAEQADEAVSVDLIAKWARRMTLSLSDSECVALVQEILAARAKDRK